MSLVSRSPLFTDFWNKRSASLMCEAHQTETKLSQMVTQKGNSIRLSHSFVEN